MNIKFLFVFLFFLACAQSEPKLNENFESLNNKSIALLIENTEKENDVKIYYGKIVRKSTDYIFIGFNNKIYVNLDIEKLSRIKKIDSQMERKVPILKDYDYFLWLTMESLPQENKEILKKTGINWEE